MVGSGAKGRRGEKEGMGCNGVEWWRVTGKGAEDGCKA